MADLWVFGYGSLMWRPGFDHVECRPARLLGAHRALCVYSWVHRGTRERPGLVLGLDRGGACSGLAFRVAGKDADAVIQYLREREQVTSVYLERQRPIRFADGGEGRAITYLVDRSHTQYAGKLDAERQFDIVSGASGVSGANRDYVLNTAAHLRELRVRDGRLEWLAARLAAMGEANEARADGSGMTGDQAAAATPVQ